MRWPFGRGKARAEAAPPSWAEALGEVGRAIDAHPNDLRDVAVTFAGGRVLVAAVETRYTHTRYGRAAVTLELIDGRLVPVEAAP